MIIIVVYWIEIPVCRVFVLSFLGFISFNFEWYLQHLGRKSQMYLEKIKFTV